MLFLNIYKYKEGKRERKSLNRDWKKAQGFLKERN